MHFLRKWLLTILVNLVKRLQTVNGKHIENRYSSVRKGGLFFQLFYIDLKR